MTAKGIFSLYQSGELYNIPLDGIEIQERERPKIVDFFDSQSELTRRYEKEEGDLDIFESPFYTIYVDNSHVFVLRKVVEEFSRVYESNSLDTANMISEVLSGLQNDISQLDTLCRDSANLDSKLIKKDLQDLVRQMRFAVRSISEIVSHYHPNINN